MAGETIMSIAYGLDVKEKGDPYVATAERGVHPLVAAAVPGAFLVDAIPALKYVPAWMPFAGFQRKARVWRELAMTMINMPFEAAKCKIWRLHAVLYVAQFREYGRERRPGPPGVCDQVDSWDHVCCWI